MNNCDNCHLLAQPYEKEPCASCQEYDGLGGVKYHHWVGPPAQEPEHQEWRADNLFVTVKPIPAGDVSVGHATLGIASDGVFSAHLVGALSADELRELAAILLTAANACDRMALRALETT